VHGYIFHGVLLAWVFRKILIIHEFEREF